MSCESCEKFRCENCAELGRVFGEKQAVRTGTIDLCGRRCRIKPLDETGER